MFRLILRGLSTHKVRLAATAIAVMLGVGFIAGTYVLTDTLKASISSLVGQSQANVAILVQAKSAASVSSTGSDSQPHTIPQSTIASVAKIPGIKADAGSAIGLISVFRVNGTPLSKPGSIDLGLSVGNVASLRSLVLRSGRFPVSGGEAVIDVSSSKRFGLRIGNSIKVGDGASLETLKIVGIVGYGNANSLGGATIVGMTLQRAESVLGQPGQVNQVVASGDAGITPTVLKSRVQSVLGPSFSVETQQQAEVAATSAVDKGLSIFSDVLLVFAGVALFVALFLIFNTFSILLAQRAKELALLRCLGAYRHQLVISVLIEALAIGLVASVLGLGLGVLLALGIRTLLGEIGISFPNVAPVIAMRTIVVSVVVGVLTTMIAALLPAFHGSRASPIGAFRSELPVDVGKRTPLRWTVGILFILIGLVVVARALHANGGHAANAASRAEQAAFGLLASFVGLSALVPIVAKPLASILGWPFAKLHSIPGKFGRLNAMRHPRRTAATASALMIGLTLITTIAVFSTSVQDSTTASLDSGLHADFLITPKGIGQFSALVGKSLKAVPQLTSVAVVKSGSAKIEGLAPSTSLGSSGSSRSSGSSGSNGSSTKIKRKVSITGVDIEVYKQDVSIPAVAGTLSSVTGNSVAITTGTAKLWQLHVGSVLPLASFQAPTKGFRVAAIFEDPTGLTGDILLALNGFSMLFPKPGNYVDMVMAKASPGTSSVAGFLAASRTMHEFPEAQVQTKQSFIDAQNLQFQQLISIITAMLLLAVVIALFGIVNTLALSVVERTREIGLLRALGMSKVQVRSAIRWESVIISLLGTTLGIAFGLLFGWVVVDALRPDGVDVFGVPIQELIVIVILAGLAGVIAALLPARSAANVDVLAAIASE